MAVEVRPGDVDRSPTERVGGAVIGDRLEHEFALDLEEVADLVEDPGKVSVGGQLRIWWQGRGFGLVCGGHGPMVAPAGG